MSPSGSERRDGYDRLHVEIRRWIHDEGWSELRDIQERTIHPALDDYGYVLNSASTAAGKTEAAFLPILTEVADTVETGLAVVYVAPLKALINDQYRRLLPLCERLDMPIVRWHGDAPQADKTRTLRNPRGVVLIAPESLEAMFVRRSGGLGRLFGNVRFVVVDELHAFLSGPLWLHLHSLLNRLDGAGGRTFRRVGLSTTIGDSQAAEWMAPGKPATIVRAIAAIRLLVARSVEPPGADPSIATVVLHQILSIICERGGEKTPRLYADICGKGPLASLGKAGFVAMLRAMADPEVKLVEQAPDGTIMLGEAGEAITTGRDFYAIFETDQEWKLVSERSTLGTIPVANSVGVGSLLAFAGRRWQIVDVDDRTKTLRVEMHRSGKLPIFEGLVAERMHDRLLAEVRRVYEDADVSAFLDAQAKTLLQRARNIYRAHRLDKVRILAAGGDTQVFLWRGTAMSSLCAIALTSQGHRCSAHDIGVTATNATPETVVAATHRITDDPQVTVAKLSRSVGNLRSAKFDRFVPNELLRHLWIVRHTNLEGRDTVACSRRFDGEFARVRRFGQASSSALASMSSKESRLCRLNSPLSETSS